MEKKRTELRKFFEFNIEVRCNSVEKLEMEKKTYHKRFMKDELLLNDILWLDSLVKTKEELLSKISK